MTGLRAIGPEAVRGTLADSLRLLAGLGRLYSTAQLADAADIGESTLKSYLRGEATPGLDQFLRLAAVLPPSFASALTRLAGLEAVPVDPAPASLLQVNAEAAQLVAGLAEALRDGRLDHREEAALRPQLEQLNDTLSAALMKRGNG
jgi:transcriptional regulator with XRE-family HTH domain